MPPAGNSAPPASRIADPVRPTAGCSGWYEQSRYGDQWSVASTWWEYRCEDSVTADYPHCPVGTGACTAVCYGYPVDCYSTGEDWIDYFVWDGTNAVFYGQTDDYWLDDYGSGVYSGSSSYWWDAAATRWYAA